MLHIDLPTHADIEALAAYRGAPAVSIYLRTTPVTQDTDGRPHRAQEPAEGRRRPARGGRHGEAVDLADRAGGRGADRRRRLLGRAGAQPGDLRDAGADPHLPAAEPAHQPCRGRRPVPHQAAAERGDLPEQRLRAGDRHGRGAAGRGRRRPAAARRQGAGPAQGHGERARPAQPPRAHGARAAPASRRASTRC